MVTPSPHNTDANSASWDHPINRTISTGVEVDSRPTQVRIRIRIPKTYHQEPVISRLVSDYGLTVNITAALLGANARDDGWFDLELNGPVRQIDSALTYLNELDLEVWRGSDDQDDGW